MASAKERKLKRISRAVSKVRDRRENVTIGKLRSSFYDQLIADVMRRFDRESKLTTKFASRAFTDSWFKRTMNGLLIPQLNLTIWSGVKYESDWIKSGKPKGDQSLQDAERQLRKGAEKPPKGFAVDVPESMLREIRKHLTERELTVWEFAARTTKTRIRRAIQRSIRDGHTLKDATKELQRELRRLKKYEAVRIARTETTSAMNFGQHQMRVEAEITSKMWISTIDSKTRRPEGKWKFDHLKPNGQKRANVQLFELTGPNGSEYLLHPGDGSNGASAGNLINCRCAAVADL